MKNPTRPFMVHFFRNGKPDSLLVLATSSLHAIELMYLYHLHYHHSLSSIVFDPDRIGCSVSLVPYFSDSLYKKLTN